MSCGLHTAYLGNDNLIWLRDVVDQRSGDPVATGIGTVTTITDSDGTEITGVTFPLTMIVSDATKADWVVQLDDAAVLTSGEIYTAKIDLIDNISGAKGHWEPQFMAQTRSSS